MSINSAPVDAHGHDHGQEAHEAAHAHGTLKSYLIGFGLSVVLTAIPFWLVMGDVLGNKQATGLVIMAFAAVQIVVHMIYFLHMTTSAEQGWTMMALIFTIVMVVIALAGSLWVMHHLTTNMMPAHDMIRR
ncbi:cytochrome o ubiquinol oxidase subunit IV [Rhodopseudomonas palustris]|uniref:cytochrome o ubiquinol oxidase subunit IV n=1 Tax=Rhodopseudomonas palustris TaxID=1076 RepID=UPI002ACD2DE6|nr:cytochrome o ubiquinol oxidase subunit IV [Rhodopseudomonas palustris]WQG98801.1 cytochrome o ubiquinol oxidase subunit IV [Rhodopseudomonas palustris]